MNIFFLDSDPEKSAEYHCDKHVVKMLLEIVQLLFTAHHILGTPKELLAYKPISNVKHPMCIWIIKSSENYKYGAVLGLCLSKEYTYRYEKIHSCDKHIKWLINNVPNCTGLIDYSDKTVLSKNNILNLTRIPLCMPEDSMNNNTIESYRKYYRIHKVYFAKWTSRNVPHWFHYSDIRKYF
jgi:hypothetical protein